MLSSTEATALNAIDRHALLRDLEELIAIPSLGGEEAPAQEWMARRLASLGLAVDVWEIDFRALAQHPSFTMEVPRSAGLGVVGTLGDAKGPTFVLNGHVD